ncbi:MAG: hypothetical protein AAF492_00550, partial [Verrucomicrobiota bacterium]
PATVHISMLSHSNHPPGLWYAHQRDDNIGPNPRTRVSLDLSEADSGYRDHYKIFTGYFYDADGHVSFTENIRANNVLIMIDDDVVHVDDVWHVRSWTDDLNLTPGLHRIEIRTDVSGVTPGSPALGYDPNGGTNWIQLADPGDGSVLRHALSEAGVNVPPVPHGVSYVAGAAGVDTTSAGSDGNLDAFYHDIVTPPSNGILEVRRDDGYT